MEIKAKCTYDYKTCKAMAHAYTYKKQKPVKAMLLHIFFLSFSVRRIFI